MHTVEVHKSLDFNAYKQIIWGDFNPVVISSQLIRSTLCLVSSINSGVIYSAPSKEEAEQYISNFDFTSLGYRSATDFEITISQNKKTNLFEASISPKKAYSLNEDISLPLPLDEKSRTFLGFISDEFERIRVRAHYVLSGRLSRKKIINLAQCQFQKLQSLFQEAKVTFNIMCTSINKQSQTDMYIIYILNLFLIRTQIFYAKIFEPFIGKSEMDEQTLRDNLYKEMPRKLNYPWLIFHRPIIYNISPDENISYSSETNSHYQGSGSIAEKVPDSIIQEALEFFQLKGTIQLNCNINAFLADVFRMAYEKDSSGNTMITAERKNILKSIAFLVVDDKGNQLNQNTISSVIKPSNIKKRPGI